MKKLIALTISSVLLFAACQNGESTTSRSAAESETVSLDGMSLTEYKDGSGISKAIEKNAKDQIIGEGELLNGQKHGTWTTYHAKNGLIESIIGYRNGVQQGAYMKASDKGYVLEKGFLKDGEFHGDYKKYIRSKVKEEATFVNGELDGLRKTYYDDGKILSEESYKNGKKDGMFKYYNQEGAVKFEQNYKNGEKVD